MTKQLFIRGLITGILTAVACIIYLQVYYFATMADFSKVINTTGLISISIITGIVASAAYGFSQKIFKQKAENIFNALFAIISFASVMIPISISLPLDIEYPELFPGLAVPMHFFPALSWFVITPFFNKVSAS